MSSNTGFSRICTTALALLIVTIIGGTSSSAKTARHSDQHSHPVHHLHLARHCHSDHHRHADHHPIHHHYSIKRTSHNVQRSSHKHFGNRQKHNFHSYSKSAHSQTRQQCGSGKATIYSDKFNGRKTATGERFRQDQLTAASPTLPLGSRVRVTNKHTGKSVTVRINDKQPRGGNRVVDLSKAAANQVGIKGTGNVQTQVLGK